LKDYKEYLINTPDANIASSSWRNGNDGPRRRTAPGLTTNTGSPNRAHKWSRDRLGTEGPKNRPISPCSFITPLEKGRASCSPLSHTSKQSDRDEESSSGIASMFEMDDELLESPTDHLSCVMTGDDSGDPASSHEIVVTDHDDQ